MDGIILEKVGSVALLTVDIPQTRNALSVPIVLYMQTLIDEIAKDKDVRALIITGGGEKSFIAGADIGRLAQMTPEDSRYSIEVGHKLFSTIEQLPFPTIAAVNGYCLGGGLEIAMCCDIRICSANAKFALPEIKIGMIPGWGGTLRLPRLIGESRAKYMILTGKMLTSSEALNCGLISETYESVAELREKAMEMATTLASYAPITMKADKAMIYDSFGKTPTEIAQRDAMTLAYIFTTKDAFEGLNAFLEKRSPNYKGE